MPMAPAPAMMIDSGSSRDRISSSYVTTFFDNEVPGTRRVLLPVAMMTLSKVTVSVPPSLSSTASVWGSVNLP